jgi:hypothetical protein
MIPDRERSIGPVITTVFFAIARIVLVDWKGLCSWGGNGPGPERKRSCCNVYMNRSPFQAFVVAL